MVAEAVETKSIATEADADLEAEAVSKLGSGSSWLLIRGSGGFFKARSGNKFTASRHPSPNPVTHAR